MINDDGFILKIMSTIIGLLFIPFLAAVAALPGVPKRLVNFSGL